jgi:hypothetical protein
MHVVNLSLGSPVPEADSIDFETDLDPLRHRPVEEAHAKPC